MGNAEITLKEQYNEIMKRWKKYESFVEDKNISMAEKVKWVKQAQNLTNDLSDMLKQMKYENIVYTDFEILNGFEIKEVS